MEASDSLHAGTAQGESHSGTGTSLEVHTSNASDAPADIDKAAGQALADALDAVQSQLDNEQSANEQQSEDGSQSEDELQLANGQQSENGPQSENVQQPTGSGQDPVDPTQQSGPGTPEIREYRKYTNAPPETTTNRFGRTVNRPDYSKGKIV